MFSVSSLAGQGPIIPITTITNDCPITGSIASPSTDADQSREWVIASTFTSQESLLPLLFPLSLSPQTHTIDSQTSSPQIISESVHTTRHHTRAVASSHNNNYYTKLKAGDTERKSHKLRKDTNQETKRHTSRNLIDIPRPQLLSYNFRKKTSLVSPLLQANFLSYKE
ncbi:hypothetical protein K435DRAFT_851636 [Dendrothele bispora CBS 962.96]|uniref:Uncharacterized protein n=1 Tax=Dendrothele bispora (strain CBS 962.96) TaxID=1314807 RepID=A0A4S8MMB9_DENBC|nr:hypothetical protein K435DRAFT_851636 [Dendrothele bispora CBS 962.96]